MSEHETAAGGTELQFDRVAQSSDSPAREGMAVECTECRESLRTEYFSINNRVVCERCSKMIERLAEPPKGAGPLIRAGMFGLCAGIGGGAVYYAVLAIAHLEIGIVAILIGYMVGSAVRRGARGRGGLRFQIVAVALTYLSVAMAYWPIVIQGAVNEQKAKTAAVAGQNAEKSQSVGVTATPAPRPKAPSMAAFLFAVILLFGFALALPVMVVVGSFPMGIIGGLIIFVGLRQAWRMTAAPVIDVYGPYKVGTVPAGVQV